jgi:O-antigen/teichoic acid export membrane protein
MHNERLSRNVMSSIGAKVLYLLSRFMMPPVILAYVTLEEYGVWSLTFVLIAYLGMGAFGVSNVYIRYVAAYTARGEQHRIGDLLSTGLMLVGAFGVICLVAVWFGLPGLLAMMSVPAALMDTAFWLVFGTVVVFMLELSIGAFAYVLTGLQHIVLQNRIWVTSFLLETLLVITFLVVGVGIMGLLYAFALRYLFSISASVWACFRAVPGLRLSPAGFNREHLGLFLKFGGVVQLSGLLGMFLRSVEKVIAGAFLNVGAVGLFDVAQKFPIMTTSIPSSMNAAFLPAATQMHAEGRQADFVNLYLASTRQINLLTGFMMGYLAAFAAPLITGWLGPHPEFALAPFILACFTLPFQLNVVTGPASTVFRASGRPAQELLYPLSQLALVAIGIGTGFAFFGIDVVVITVAVAMAMILSALLYLTYTTRWLGLSQGRFIVEAVLPGLYPYAIGLLLAFALSPWTTQVADDRLGSIVLVLVSGLLYSVLSGALVWRFTLKQPERDFTLQRLQPLRRRLRLS